MNMSPMVKSRSEPIKSSSDYHMKNRSDILFTTAKRQLSGTSSKNIFLSDDSLNISESSSPAMLSVEPAYAYPTVEPDLDDEPNSYRECYKCEASQSHPVHDENINARYTVEVQTEHYLDTPRD